jgi:hypothetical protein
MADEWALRRVQGHVRGLPSALAPQIDDGERSRLTRIARMTPTRTHGTPIASPADPDPYIFLIMNNY